jgi:hypothetical protein
VRPSKSAREKYFDYVADARLDRSEQPIESDERAQAEIASDLSEVLDDTLHDYTDKLDKLREVDFWPRSAVTEGALLTFATLATGAQYPRMPNSVIAKLRVSSINGPNALGASGSVAHCVYRGGPKGAYCCRTSPE